MQHFRVNYTGVTGIGEESSMVALYQDAQGDRGVIAVQVSTLMAVVMDAAGSAPPSYCRQPHACCDPTAAVRT